MVGKMLRRLCRRIDRPKRLGLQAKRFFEKGKKPEPFLWRMTLDCYDFDAGQPRHFPAGTYYEQKRAFWGGVELDIMRELYRCWLLFKHRKLKDWTMDDQKYVAWLAEKPPIDDTALNRVILGKWLPLAH